MNLNKVKDVLLIIGRFHSIRERERECVCMCIYQLYERRMYQTTAGFWSCMYKRDLLEKKSGVDTRMDGFFLVRATLAKKGLGTENEIGEVTRSYKHILNQAHVKESAEPRRQGDALHRLYAAAWISANFASTKLLCSHGNFTRKLAVRTNMMRVSTMNMYSEKAYRYRMPCCSLLFSLSLSL